MLESLEGDKHGDPLQDIEEKIIVVCLLTEPQRDCAIRGTQTRRERIVEKAAEELRRISCVRHDGEGAAE